MSKSTDQSFTNPILDGPTWIAGLMRRREHARPGVAMVLGGGRGGLVTEWPQRTWSLPEDRRAGFRYLYEVSIAEHPLRFSCKAPCDGGAYHFYVDVELSWWVHDPAVVVERNLTEVVSQLRVTLEEPILRISRGCAVEDGGLAAERINEELGGEPRQLDFGVSYKRFLARLHVDQAQVEQLRKLKSNAWERDFERDRDVTTEDNRLRERRQTAHELALTRERYDFFLETLRMSEGSVNPALINVLAHQLASRSGDIQQVVELIRNEGHAKLGIAVKTLEVMLDQGQIDGWKLRQTRDAVLGLLAGLRSDLPEPERKALGQPAEEQGRVRVRGETGAGEEPPAGRSAKDARDARDGDEAEDADDDEDNDF